MAHIWGINWQSHHKDQYDFPHIKRMSYKLVLLYNWMWDNDGFCNDLLAAAPSDCIFIIRDQPLSEQKSDMYADPVGTGRRHAREWAEKIQQGRVKLPLDRCWFQGINEPDSNHAQQAIDIYTLELTLGLAAVGARVSGWVFGTGHPSTVNLSPTGPVDWHWYAASAQALAEHDGLADFHAYGSWNNMMLDNHLCRMETCPYALPVVFTETGIDEGAVSRATAGQGYKAHLSPDQYIAWLNAMQLQVRQRIGKSKLTLKALGIFTYDFGEAEDSQSWEPYDIRPLRAQLEAAQWTTPPYTKPQEYVYIPMVTQPGPDTPTAAPVQPQPPAPVNDDDWQRSMAFVLGQEGGLSTDPNDAGNYVDGVFVGTKYGISAQAHPDVDIVNLTIEQAREIYRVQYWQASGANTMPWPLCLAVFDLAVNGGVGRAKQALTEAGSDFTRFMAWRLKWYCSIKNFDRYGRAWIRRCAELMQEAVR